MNIEEEIEATLKKRQADKEAEARQQEKPAEVVEPQTSRASTELIAGLQEKLATLWQELEPLLKERPVKKMAIEAVDQDQTIGEKEKRRKKRELSKELDLINNKIKSLSRQRKDLARQLKSQGAEVPEIQEEQIDAAVVHTPEGSTPPTESAIVANPPPEIRPPVDTELVEKKPVEEVIVPEQVVDTTLAGAAGGDEQTPPPPPGRNGPGKKEPKREKPITAAEVVEAFIKDFGLEGMLPEGFGKLSPEAQYLVVYQLKQRIVDIVTSNAQTKYSEDFKKKLEETTGIFNKLFVKKLFVKIGGRIKKEATLKKNEVQLFRELKSTDAGKAVISENLTLLTARITGQEVFLGFTGKPAVNYLHPENIPGLSLDQQMMESVDFNIAATNFAQIPYEWGQEKSGKRRSAYDKAKSNFEKVRDRMLLIMKSKEKGPGQAVTAMLQIENFIKMDQLVNTHPEVEKLFSELGKDPTIMGNIGRTIRDFGKGAVGEKGEYAGLAFVGAGLRWGARGAAVLTTMTGLTFVAAPLIGGAIGRIRGGMRAKDTLEVRKKQARHGQKDTSEAKVHTTDATLLVKRLQRTIKDIEKFSQGKEDKDKRMLERKLGLLSLTIDHINGKAKKGEINFGDANSLLVNQYVLMNTMNEAVVLEQSLSEANRVEVKKRIDSLVLKYVAPLAGKLEEKTTKGQEEFIKAQMRQGMKYGAGFATVGYIVRWAGEQFGWWGGGLEGAPDSQTPVVGTESPRVPGVEVTPPREVVGEVPIELQKIPGPGVMEAVVPPPGAGHEIISNFSIKLGEGGVPKDLETAFHAIAADHMDLTLGPGEKVSEEFATKSLNMAANLVRLVQGEDTLGIDDDQFAKIVSFKNGVLTVHNHGEFNKILDRLQEHANGLWEKGTLQGKGAAITYIPKISDGRWLEIIHAEGMDKGASLVDGARIDTGILGHDEITADQIQDFEDSDLVKRAMVEERAKIIEKARAKALEGYQRDLKTADVDLRQGAEREVPSPAEEVRGLEEPRAPGRPERGKVIWGTEESVEKTQLASDRFPATGVNVDYVRGIGIVPTPNNIGLGINLEMQKVYEVWSKFGIENLSLEEVTALNRVYENNIDRIYEHLFATDSSISASRQVIDMVLKTPAKALLEDEKTYGGDDIHTPAVEYLEKIRSVLGEKFKPRGGGFFSKPETVKEFIMRALVTAKKNGVLGSLTVRE